MVRKGGPQPAVESVAVSSEPTPPTPETVTSPALYAPGMDARSTRVAEILNTPMLIAAALTLPMVAITESKPGGTLESVAIVLNWATWVAFAIELVTMLIVVPDRRTWLRHNPLSPVIVILTPPLLPAGLQSPASPAPAAAPAPAAPRPALP